MGDRWIGIAESDGLIATPLSVLRRRSLQADLAQLDGHVAQAERVIVGLPRALSGRETDQTRRTVAFAGHLVCQGYPVVFWNEALTSVQAEEAVARNRRRPPRRRERLDAVAAAFILQDYLDSGAPIKGVSVSVDDDASVSSDVELV